MLVEREPQRPSLPVSDSAAPAELPRVAEPATASTNGAQQAARPVASPPDDEGDGTRSAARVATDADTGEAQPGEALRGVGPSGIREPSSGRQPGGPVRAVAGMGVLVILLASVALLSGPSRPTSTAPAPTHAIATHTPLPTATATGTPLPTALPGYRVYADSANAFVIQYPVTWQTRQNDAGVQISDNSSAAGYVLQVYREDSSTCAQADAKVAASCWIDTYLNGLNSQEVLQDLQRLTGPTPAVTFGGQVWQTGIATFVSAAAPFRIQVYATVYQGQPYLVAVLAPDDQFATGSELYFKPMLATFQFLPPPSG